MFKLSKFKIIPAILLVGLLSTFFLGSCSKDEETHVEVSSIDDAVGTFHGNITAKISAQDGEVTISKVNATSLKLSVKQGEAYSIPTVFTIPVKINKEDNKVESTAPNFQFSYFAGTKQLLFLATKSENPTLPSTVKFNGFKK